jgi:hypothetical protein
MRYPSCVLSSKLERSLPSFLQSFLAAGIQVYTGALETKLYRFLLGLWSQNQFLQTRLSQADFHLLRVLVQTQLLW